MRHILYPTLWMIFHHKHLAFSKASGDETAHR